MKIAVGMSGGVDSSVTAYLLKQQGFEVIGIFMKNWEDDDDADFCPAEQDAEDAEKVAKKLGIPFYTINFADEYWERVFAYFLAEYQAGRTPNPDILCNQEIKFKAFLDYAQSLGADKIATGHYAKIRYPDTTAGKRQDPVIQLLKAHDLNKDQSYFLYRLNQTQLAHALFPLGNLTKPEVRNIAAQQGFENCAKKDSTGICFIGERKFKDFLNRYLPAQPGDIVTDNGKIIGTHDGLMYYTIGQRQGLRIGGQKDGTGDPWYVAAKDLKNNHLIVVQDHDHPLLLKEELIAQDLHFIAGAPPAHQFSCQAKIRYRQSEQSCHVRIDNKRAFVTFDIAQRAVTPGQSIVFYDADVCLGGGVIT